LIGHSKENNSVKQKFISLYIDLADRISLLSHGVRLKVGAVIVKDHRILSYGYNGTPAGFDNCCETKFYQTPDFSSIPDSESFTMFPFEDGIGRYKLTSKPEVIHAEMNAIAKIANHGDSCKDATMFITHSPCIECAKLILQSGINKIYYKNVYRSVEGIELLNKSPYSIKVIKYEDVI